MTNLSLTLACNDYEWLEPLIHGDIEPDGIDITVLSEMSGGERHRRMITGEFDIAEFSLGTYITGWPDWEFTAIPAFPDGSFPIHGPSSIGKPISRNQSTSKESE
jgi:4,5-dihydroxyphthalate decarboxylase